MTIFSDFKFIDWISFLGTIITIICFIITVVQIRGTNKELKATNEKVENAINKTKYEINQIQYIKEITLLIKDFETIIDFLNDKRADIAFYLMREKQSQFVKIFTTEQYDDCMDKKKLKPLYDQYLTMQDNISNIKEETLEKTISFSSTLLNNIRSELIATSYNVENKELWKKK